MPIIPIHYSNVLSILAVLVSPWCTLHSQNTYWWMCLGVGEQTPPPPPTSFQVELWQLKNAECMLSVNARCACSTSHTHFLRPSHCDLNWTKIKGWTILFKPGSTNFCGHLMLYWAEPQICHIQEISSWNIEIGLSVAGFVTSFTALWEQYWVLCFTSMSAIFYHMTSNDGTSEMHLVIKFQWYMSNFT